MGIINLNFVRMKVIKHLKYETPEYKLKVFFKQMPLLTRLMIPLVTATSILLTILSASQDIDPYSFLDARPLFEMVLFIIIALTDFQKEERKGSIFLLLSYILKILIMMGFNKLLDYLLYLMGAQQDLFSKTSYPVLYCFMVAFRDMVLKTSNQRYFLIASFQIKYAFYPLFLGIIFELAGIRVDILGALIVSLLITAIRLDEFLMWISSKLDKRVVGERAIMLGVLATGCQDIAMSQIDRVTTNHSIVIEEN